MMTFCSTVAFAGEVFTAAGDRGTNRCATGVDGTTDVFPDKTGAGAACDAETPLPLVISTATRTPFANRLSRSKTCTKRPLRR